MKIRIERDDGDAINLVFDTQMLGHHGPVLASIINQVDRDGVEAVAAKRHHRSILSITHTKKDKDK